MQTIFAIGYSVRALVEACVMAGFDTIAIDHFGDEDTRRLAKGRWIPLELTIDGCLTTDAVAAIRATVDVICQSSITSDLPIPTPLFLLAGGMENLGPAVEQLRSIAPVAGPTDAQRIALREPMFLQKTARSVGLAFPETCYNEPQAETNTQFLFKPFASAGGLNVRRQNEHAHEPNQRPSGYWQQFVPGSQWGVTCLLHDEGSQCLSATYSLDQQDWYGPTEFIYRGSVGPILLPSSVHSRIERLCNVLRDAIGYRGWLQFDFLQSANDTEQLWLIECNPRWTSGMETLLYGASINMVQQHLVALGVTQRVSNASPSTPQHLFAKAVVYAKNTIVLSQQTINALHATSLEGTAQDFGWLADVPHAPQTILAGHPIATVRGLFREFNLSLPQAPFDSDRAIMQHAIPQLEQLAERLREVLRSTSCREV